MKSRIHLRGLVVALCVLPALPLLASLASDALIRSERQRYEKLVRETNIKPD